MKKLLFGMMTAVLTLSTGMTPAQGADSKPVAAGAEARVETLDISLADLKQAIADKAVVLLDCNGSKSYAAAHLPGAIDFESTKADLAKQLPADKSTLVVAYCGGPRCLAYQAGTAAAAKLGYTHVKHFSGGLSGWKAAGEPMGSAAACTKGKQTKGASACSKTAAAKCDKAKAAKCDKAKTSKCDKTDVVACDKNVADKQKRKDCNRPQAR